MADNCVFCKIAAGKIPAKIIFESKNILAFSDINPQAPTHLLIIPKKHAETIEALEKKDLSLGAEIFEVVKNLVGQLGLKNGYRLVANSGQDSGQAVEHLHFHLLAGRPFRWPPG